VEDDQPDLLQATVDTVCAGAAADERRRCEKLSTCKTLDDLHEALMEQRSTISRPGTYLPDADKGRRGVKNYQIFADVLYGWSLSLAGTSS